jgi:hypothetical protein
MIRAPVPTHPPQKQAKGGLPGGRGGRVGGVRRSHPEQVSRGTPRGRRPGTAGSERGARDWLGGARARGGGILARTLRGGGGGGGTGAGEPETASQFIYKPGASRPPARRHLLLPPPRSHPRPSRALQSQPRSSSNSSSSSSSERAAGRAQASRLPLSLAGVGPHCPAPSWRETPAAPRPPSAPYPATLGLRTGISKATAPHCCRVLRAAAVAPASLSTRGRWGFPWAGL